MNQLTGKGILVAIWVCFGAAYPFYCWVAQAGLLRWLVDLELTLQGKGPYVIHPSWLMIPTLLISWIIPAAIYRPALYMMDQLLPPPAAIIEVPRPMTYAPAPAPAAGDWARNPVVICIAVGSLASIAVGVRAGVIAYRRSSEAVTFEALNLAGGAPPSSKHVKLTGLAVPSLKSQYTERRKSSYLNTYIPVVPPHWRQGDPVVYFLHPDRDSFGNTEPVMIEQTGVLMRDALPGAAAFLCKKHGITLGTPTFVLEYDAHADVSPYIGTALYCILIGLAFFLPWASRLVRELFHRH
jgi:hypothetical protein